LLEDLEARNGVAAVVEVDVVNWVLVSQCEIYGRHRHEDVVLRKGFAFVEPEDVVEVEVGEAMVDGNEHFANLAVEVS
jgi:hypothetical protein